MSNPTGAELREEREAADIKSIELAAKMGVVPSRVSQIEALASVTPRTARKYRDALDAVRAVSPVSKTPAGAS